MLILLCRHAQAAERDDALFPDDTLRPLVPRGRKAAARVGRRLRRRGYLPAVILSSPWRRAWQTAGIMADESRVGRNLRVPCPALATEPNLAAIAEAVGTRDPEDVVVMVGHEPWLGGLGSLLLTGSGTRLPIRFAKGGVLAIESDAIGPGGGRLRFYWER